MLSILLTILKILLLTVLGLLGLVLLLVLIVLFAPIRYKAHIEYHDKAVVDAKVKFLFVSVLAHFYQESKDFGYKIKVFGIPLGIGKPKKEKKVKPERTKKSARKSKDLEAFEDEFEESDVDISSMTSEDASETVNTLNETTESVDITKSVDITGDLSAVTDEKLETLDVSNDSSSIEEDLDDSVSEEELDEILNEKPSLKERIISFLEGVKNKSIKIGEKLSDFDPDEYIEGLEDKLEKKLNKAKKKINQFKKFINLKCTKKTIKYLKKYLKGALKRLLPRKVKGYIKFGLDNPATMGKLVGYLSLMPWTYGSKRFYIEPVFNEKVIDADIKLKGHFNLAYFVKIVLNINLWRTLKVLKKITGGN